LYVVGALIIDTYAGSYTDFVRERFFVPLNMSDSTFVPSEANMTGRATQTWTNEGRRVPWWFTDDDYKLSAGPGGVIASAEGLVRLYVVFPLSTALTQGLGKLGRHAAKRGH
jgi:CubicO group peptidase (beta-lactamase class C family)